MSSQHLTAEMAQHIITQALEQRVFIEPHPELVSLVPRVENALTDLAERLGGVALSKALEEHRKKAHAADRSHDGIHRLVQRLLVGLSEHYDVAVAAAAALLLEVLYPKGLTIVTASWEAEVAHRPTYGKRLEREDVVAAIEVIKADLPRVDEYFAKLGEATEALAEALSGIAAAEVERAGKPVDKKLFEARVKAIQVWSGFARIVELVYEDDSPTSRAAREALLGRWNRILALEPSSPQPAEQPAEEPPAEG